MPKLFFTRSLNNRIISLLLGIGLLPLCILGGWTYQQTLTTLIDGRIERMTGLMDAKKREIEMYLLERIGDLTVLTVNEQVMQVFELTADPQQKENNTNNFNEKKKQFSVWLDKYKSAYRYHDVSLVSITGEILFTSLGTGIQGQNLTRGILQESGMGRAFASASNGTSVQDFLLAYQMERQQIAFFSSPVFRQDVRLGVVILQISEQVINDLMAQISGLGESGEMFLVGKTAEGFALRSNRRGSQGRIGDLFSFPKLDTALAGNSGVLQRTDRNGVLVLTSYAPLTVPGVQWVIVSQVSMNEVEQPVRVWATLFALFTVLLSLLSVLLSWLLGRNLVTPITALAQTAHEIAGGNWSARVSMSRDDEIGRLGAAFNSMADTIEEQNWLKSKAATLRDFVSQMESEEVICREVIGQLAMAVGAGQGAIFVQGEEDVRYHLRGSFAYRKRKHFDHSFAPGEYLVGQCALEKQTIIHSHIPADYTEIGSGLGKASPINLILVPVVTGEAVVAVMELASFQPFTPAHVTLLENIAPSLGLALEKLRQSRRTATLLNEVQRQAAELTTQQEELQQVNRVLEQQSHDLVASEEELRAQNELLNEKTRDLELANSQMESRQEALQQTRAALVAKAGQLESASRYKSEFLASMSHELRTPLNSILIIASNLLDNTEGNLTPNQMTSARILQESGQDLLQLINGILDLSKIEAGKMELRPQEVRLAEMLEEVRRGFLPVAQQKALTFAVESSPDLPDTLRMDLFKVQQVLRNFLSNAFKFTQQGGVTLRVSRSFGLPDGCLQPVPTCATGFLTFAVTDTGIGIAQEKRTLIFDAFQQAEGGIDRKYGGTGLGLSISKALAELMRGVLCMTSGIGQGSTFILALPWEQVANLSAVLPAPHLADGKPLLLIIEDDPTFADFVTNLAVERGFAVYHATTGYAGLEAIASLQPQGVILDIGLPDMDGWTLLDSLRDNLQTRGLPVHVVSALDPAENFLQSKGVGFVGKPASREQLLQILDSFSTHGERSKVLVLDADPVFREQLLALTSDMSVVLEFVLDPDAAMSQLHTGTFTCVILDPFLFGERGAEILRVLSSHPYHAKIEVILCSSRELSREEHDRLQPFADRIMMKGRPGESRMLDELTLFLHSLESKKPGGARRLPLLSSDDLLKDRQVLLVDDDIRNTFALTQTLESKGMRTLMAPDGTTALHLLAQHPETEIVLMDVMMPGLDGLETIRRIRAQECFAKLPIIALTAKAMRGDREEAMKAGVSDYLAKPVDLDRLFSLMRVWLYPQGSI